MPEKYQSQAAVQGIQSNEGSSALLNNWKTAIEKAAEGIDLSAQQQEELRARSGAPAIPVFQGMSPVPEGSLSPASISPLPEGTEKVQQVANKTAFAHLEMLKLLDKTENFQTHRLISAKEKGDKYADGMDELSKLLSLLIPLSSELQEDGSTQELSEEIKQSLEVLRTRQQIDVIKGDLNSKKLTKEELLSYKSLIDYHMDVIKTKINQLLNGEVAMTNHLREALINVMKATYDDLRKLSQIIQQHLADGK